jgi:hypothetical protein
LFEPLNSDPDNIISYLVFSLSRSAQESSLTKKEKRKKKRNARESKSDKNPQEPIRNE